MLSIQHTSVGPNEYEVLIYARRQEVSVPFSLPENLLHRTLLGAQVLNQHKEKFKMFSPSSHQFTFLWCKLLHHTRWVKQNVQRVHIHIPRMEVAGDDTTDCEVLPISPAVGKRTSRWQDVTSSYAWECLHLPQKQLGAHEISRKQVVGAGISKRY